LDAALADGDLYVKDAARATKLARDRAEAARRLEAAEESWLEMSAEYEAANADPTA